MDEHPCGLLDLFSKFSELTFRVGKVVSRGHNMRVQKGDPTAHAEVVAIR